MAWVVLTCVCNNDLQKFIIFNTASTVNCVLMIFIVQLLQLLLPLPPLQLHILIILITITPVGLLCSALQNQQLALVHDLEPTRLTSDQQTPLKHKLIWSWYPLLVVFKFVTVERYIIIPGESLVLCPL